MSKNFKRVSLLLLAGGLCFSGNIRAEIAPPKPVVGISQQSGKVLGTVEDDFGPVTGASVSIKGTTNGTVTDLDGNFSLDGVSNGSVLVISFIGYITEEIVYTGQPSLHVHLKEDSQTLDEVVVTALGIKKDAKKLGYAVSTIDAGDIVKTGTPNFATSLYGKASGVRIQAAPGGGTSSVSINIRGLSSMTGSTQPLVIMDGVPIRNGDANNKGYWEDQRVNSNGLVDINPEDIESLSILKGASASALYGSEAANGVVMITTKSGKGSKGLGVDFSASLTADFIAYMPTFQKEYGPGRRKETRAGYEITSDGFVEINYKGKTYERAYSGTAEHWGAKYDGRDLLYWDGSVRSYSPQTGNPWKEIFRTGVNQTYSLSLTQGSEKSNMRLSYTYVDSQPTQRNSDYNKHNFSLSGGTNINKQFRVDYTANYQRQYIKNRPYRINRLTNNYSGMAGSFEDISLLKNTIATSLGYKNNADGKDSATPDEQYLYQPALYEGLGEGFFWNTMYRTQEEDYNRFIASVTPTWNIMEGLTLRGRISTDLTTEKIELKENTEQSLAFGSSSTKGHYSLNNKRYEIYYGDVMLMYDKNLTEKFGLNASIGYQGRVENVYNAKVGTEGGLSVENWFHINSSIQKANSDMVKQEFLKTAWLGILSLSWDNYLFLEGTIRQEKTSTLKSGNNAFWYPSINASFLYTEAFKDNLPDWYDYGKIRASYGIVGNAPEIYRANLAYTQFSKSGYTYNVVGKDKENNKQTLGNEGIRPEEKHEFEVGLENKFLNNRLGFEVSYYTNVVKDQILPVTTPQSAGASSILQNVGELKNTGVEISLYGTPVQTRHFRWDLRGNLSFNKNKVSKLMDGVDYIEHHSEDNGAILILSKEGQAMGDIYAYIPKVDANGNKIVDDQGYYEVDFTERKKVGNAMPKAVGGVGTTLSYKNFFMDATIDFNIGGSVVNIPYYYMMGYGLLEETLPNRDAASGGLTYVHTDGNTYDNGIILPGVKKDGTPNDIIIGTDAYHRRTYAWGASGRADYSRAVFDNTFVKLRELSFGYTLPKNLTSKFACNNLTLSVFGRNLFYFYKNLPQFDAEAVDGTNWTRQAVIGGSTVTTRTFGVSLRASF